MRGADAAVAALRDLGCDTIFALSGNQIMPLFDACLDADIRLVHTRHEAAAGFMAEGHAQITGRPGVALVTAGAGLGNAIAPLLTARASQTPLILLSGDSPVAKDGTGAFQEMDQVALTASLTKLSLRVTKPDDLAGAISKAWAAASQGQPGPVHLSLPADVLEAQIGGYRAPVAPLLSEPPDVGDAVRALETATHPLILLGPALRAAVPALSSLGVPVLCLESPRGAKDPSLGQFSQSWPEADLVLAIGKPIDFSVGFGAQPLWPKAQWITVHGDASESARAGRNLGDRLLAAQTCDPWDYAQALSQAPATPRPDWCDRVHKLASAQVQDDTTGLTSATLCSVVGRVVTPDTVLVCDGGEFGQWAQTIRGAGQRIVNGVSGAIGAGLCYAIAARCAAPNAPVMALMGDGTAGFHLPEFETAVRENLPFVAVVGNDRRWNAEHQIQQRDFGVHRTHSCTLSNMRYDLAVQAMGGFGRHVTRLDDLEDALGAALNSGLPACVNVEMDGLPAPVF